MNTSAILEMYRFLILFVRYVLGRDSGVGRADGDFNCLAKSTCFSLSASKNRINSDTRFYFSSCGVSCPS
jgi:hypothetical protein